MKREFIVDNILHSGRKADRYTPVYDQKYAGIMGYNVRFDVDNLRRGKSLHMDVLNSPIYDWWDTSIVLAATIDERDDSWTIETENTIYILKGVHNDNTD